MRFWRTQWGKDIWCAHGSERSAGVVTLKNRFTGEILHTQRDGSGHYLCQTLKIHGSVLLIANVYGFNSQFPDLSLIIGGDFNTVMDGFLDCLPARQSYNQNTNLKRFMERFNLVDIWRSTFPDSLTHTWSNKSGNRQSRIDYWLVSANMQSSDVSVNVISSPLSDHKAVLISINFSTSPHMFY